MVKSKKKTEEHRCHDCGVKEGGIHKLGCDMERCPFCGGQLISCDCPYKVLGLDFDISKPFCGLPQAIYEKGLTKEMNQKLLEGLDKKGRVPYILYPSICGRCGKVNPEFFMVPAWVWWKYIQKGSRKLILCEGCWSTIVNLIDMLSGIEDDTMVPCPVCSSTDSRCYYCRGNMVEERFVSEITQEHSGWKH
jgi:hypothetical protein